MNHKYLEIGEVVTANRGDMYQGDWIIEHATEMFGGTLSYLDLLDTKGYDAFSRGETTDREFIVLAKGSHYMWHNPVAYIQDRETGLCYLIGTQGLESTGMIVDLSDMNRNTEPDIDLEALFSTL